MQRRFCSYRKEAAWSGANSRARAVVTGLGADSRLARIIALTDVGPDKTMLRCKRVHDTVLTEISRPQGTPLHKKRIRFKLEFICIKLHCWPHTVNGF